MHNAYYVLTSFIYEPFPQSIDALQLAILSASSVTFISFSKNLQSNDTFGGSKLSTYGALIGTYCIAENFCGMKFLCFSWMIDQQQRFCTWKFTI